MCRVGESAPPKYRFRDNRSVLHVRRQRIAWVFHLARWSVRAASHGLRTLSLQMFTSKYARKYCRPPLSVVQQAGGRSNGCFMIIFGMHALPKHCIVPCCCRRRRLPGEKGFVAITHNS